MSAMSIMTPEREQAERFLPALDPTTESFTFQTFDDNIERKKQRARGDPFAKVLHGTLAQHWPTLVKLNQQGVGIFVTVNRTTLRGRRACENIVAVRANFADLDGAPLQPCVDALKPHIITETSPGKFHVVWRVGEEPLDQFEQVQRAITARFGADDLHDLPRVLRMPGFYHCKGEAQLCRILTINNEMPPYPFAEIDAAFSPDVDPEFERQLDQDAGKGTTSEEKSEFRKINDAAMANLSAWVPQLFPQAKSYKNGYRVTSAKLGRKLEEDIGILPEGIVDFGVHDMGDPHQGRRTPIDLVMEWGNKDVTAAAAWLRAMLGGTGSAEPNRPGTPDDGGHHETWPCMDDEAYHGIAGEFVRTISPHSEADPVALLIQFLICFGSIIGRCRYYQVESDWHHANLFAALIGQTSRGRKGTSLNRVMAIARGADLQWVDNNVKGGLSSGEGLINVVRDPCWKWDKDKNVDVEIDRGVRDKRLLIVEPEFAGVLAVMARGGNTISHLVRKAWDGGKLATMTRTMPLTATGAHISVIGHITRDELRTHLTRTDMANGFANRFLFALIRRSRELPFGGDLTDSQIQHLGEELKHIVESITGDIAPALRLTMTEEARALWQQLYANLTTEQPGLLGALTARAEAQVIRLALIYALLDKQTRIDVPHLKAGLAVWEYCEASTAHIFGTAIGDEMADEILRGLVASRSGMTRTMIYALFAGHRSHARISAALALLQEKRLARMTRQHTGGRPVETWFAT
jgi:hypothetical protein